MNPAERLRAITRHLDDDAVAFEAAAALAGFDPASLVVACRRLLAHHPACGPLWWVAARVLAAPDADAACREAARLLDADRTADRLAVSLPLAGDDELIGVVGRSVATERALGERVDLPVVALRLPGRPEAAATWRQTGRDLPLAGVDDASFERIARLLVPASAIGSGRALVPTGTGELIERLGERRGPGSEAWLVGGVGRVLPKHLYEAAEQAALGPSGSGGEPAGSRVGCEAVALERFDRVAGPRGAEPSAEADARPDCPVVPELLRPL